MLDFAVSLSKVMVTRNDIIHYLVHSNAVDELEHREVHTMSKELLWTSEHESIVVSDAVYFLLFVWSAKFKYTFFIIMEEQGTQ